MTTVLTRITAQEFLEEYDTRGLELIDGQIEEVEIGAEAAWITKNVLKAVEAAAPPTVGLAFQNDVGIQVWPERPDRVRKPDGMFFGRDRLPSVPQGWITAIPSLVWEVVSPHDRAPVLREKLEDYREAAVPIVWVLYPGLRVIDVHRVDGSSTRLGPGDALTCAEVLPGFAVAVEDLFTVP